MFKRIPKVAKDGTMRGCEKQGKDVPCAECGKLVYRYQSTMNRKYCSFPCRDAAKKRERVDETAGIAKCAKCREWKPIADFVRGQFGRPHSYCKPCTSLWFHERRGTPKDQRKAYVPAYRLTPEQKHENKRAANHRAHQARRAAGPAPHKFDVGRMICMQDDRCTYCQTALGSKYHIDHMLPIARGGTNALTNLQLLCPKCNMQKGAMTLEDFLVSKKNRRRVTKAMNESTL